MRAASIPDPRERTALLATPDEQRARVAWLYYAESMTQVQIARLLRISRAKVIALLAAARDSGLVRVRIDFSGGVIDQELRIR